MKSKITKIWGVGLTLVLATTMLLFPMPASAGTLSWSSETIPSTSGYRIADGDVKDLAVSAGGDIIYSVNGTEYMYRSTNSGETWSMVTIDDHLYADFVAVAPDDENYIAVAGNSTYVYISDDAGANWDSLSTITTLTGMTDIYDLALSVAKSGKHFVAVAGIDTPLAEVAYYEIGAVGAEWKDATGADGTYGTGWTTGDVARAVVFSPNFASDEVMVALSGNHSAESLDFQIFSFDQKEWNGSAGFTDYSENLRVDATDYGTFDAAAIALAPDYLGSDDSMRLAFVAITCSGTLDAGKNSGIQRLEDDDATTLKEKVHMNSIAYDGTNLVAGRYDTNTVYRSADPLASSPSVSGSAGLKSPGLNTSYYEKVIVAWSGLDVVAGTRGDESAFSVSEDNGKTFNDISLIDTTLTNLSDVAVSADGSNIYLATDSSDDGSLWRYASRWERVLTTDNKTDFIIRTAPDDMDVVYVADKNSTTIYYSSDAGQSKWHTRIATENVEDLAVETDGDVVYVASSGGYVSKSTNSGFTWATKKSSKLSGISMIISLGEDLLLAGAETEGKAAYSKDGNTTWTKLADGMTDGAVQVIADGLDEGDLVVAGVNAADDHLYRWDWVDEEWDEIADLATGFVTTGIVLQDGILYSVSANTTGNNSKLARSLDPTADDPAWDTVDSVDEEFTATPSALRVSVSDTTNKLWAIDEVGPYLFSYKDTLALTPPTLLAPREGFENKINPISGTSFDITFSWVRPSKEVTGYDFYIALDSTFDEVVLSQTLANDSSTVGVVAGPTGSTIETISFEIAYMPGTTYYWKVRTDAFTIGTTDYGPIRGQWSDVRSFKMVESPVTPAVEVAPTPEITVTIPPAPSVTLPAPEIIIPTPEIVLPAPQITLPPSPAPVAPIPGWALYAIIFIGAVLVIALIVLILRTRRPV